MVRDPDIYLGAKLKKTTLQNGIITWGVSPSKYVQEAVKNCEAYLETNYLGKWTLPKNAPNPFVMNYAPEMDVSPALDATDASYFQSLIGILRWTVEIGRIDIATKISMLSSHLAYPREGHLEAALHVMGYMKHKHNSRLVFDPTYPFVDLNTFET